MNSPILLVAGVLAALLVAFLVLSPGEKGAAVAFGGKADISFADKLWAAMGGYPDWSMKSGVYPGTSPHGAFLRMYYNVVHVAGRSYHMIVKDNFDGEGATVESVSQSPEEFLATVTVMVQREPGYDEDNNNWFWAKYSPDGTIDRNPAGVALAGRVAKGADTGCIACHRGAGGNDYVFTND